MLSEGWPELAQFWSTSAKLWPTPAKFGGTLPRLANIDPKLGPIRPNVCGILADSRLPEHLFGNCEGPLQRRDKKAVIMLFIGTGGLAEVGTHLIGAIGKFSQDMLVTVTARNAGCSLGGRRTTPY